MIRDAVCELREYISRGNWDWFITINPNQATRSYRITSDLISRQRDLLKRWHAIADRKLLGHRWDRKPASNRTFFVAFPEAGPKGDLVHWHCLVTAPKDFQTDRLLTSYRGAWQTLCPDGQIDIGPYSEKAAWYSTKKLWSEFGMENFIISTEFHRSNVGNALSIS